MVFLVNLGRIVFAPLIEPLAADFGVSPAELGVVATLAWLGSALSRVPTGYLLTRLSRHVVVVGAGVGLTAAALFTALAPSIPVLVTGAFLLGLASGTYFAAANPLVSELFPEGVGRALGVHGTAAGLAAVLAPVGVGAVLVVGDWRLTFFGIAGLGAVVTLYTLYAGRGADLPDAGADDRHLLRAVRAQWPIVLTGIGVVGSVGFVWNGLFNYYVSYLVAGKGLTPGTARTLLTVVFAAGLPAFLLTGRLADRVSNVPLLLVVIGGFVATVYALTLASGLAAIVAVSAILGYVIHSLFPVVDTYLLASLPDRHRASAYTAYSAVMMIVQAQGSLAVGSLVGSGLAYDTVFAWFAGGLLVVLLGLVGLHLAGRIPAGRVPGTPAREG
jgi:predicted MFS family arabinose efflux permease